ncbi:MAG TPA: hypothetical protein VIC33_08725 [Vicinamibacterales bacterium]
MTTVQAAIHRPVGPAPHAPSLQAELSGPSVQALRHYVSSIRHELGRYSRHGHHHRLHSRVADLVRRPAVTSVSHAVQVRVADDDQAVQNGPIQPWREDRLLPEAPASSGVISQAGSPRLPGNDHVEPHSPRGPPVFL